MHPIDLKWGLSGFHWGSSTFHDKNCTADYAILAVKKNPTPDGN